MTESTLDLLTRAHKHLTELRDQATEGPWEALSTGTAGGDHWYIVAGGEAIASVSAQDGFNEAERGPTAHLIVALHRTIDAQLEILRGWRDYLIERERLVQERTLLPHGHPLSSDNPILALALSILGEDA